MSGGPSRPLEARRVSFHWNAVGPIEPAHLATVVEDLGRYAHDTLPGSMIESIMFDGTKLVITLREAS